MLSESSSAGTTPIASIKASASKSSDRRDGVQHGSMSEIENVQQDVLAVSVNIVLFSRPLMKNHDKLSRQSNGSSSGPKRKNSKNQACTYERSNIRMGSN